MVQKYHKFENLTNDDEFQGIRCQIFTESHQGQIFAPAKNQVQK